MATKIIHKKSSVAGKIPSSGDLEVGELALNLEDQKLYSKKTDGTVVELAANNELEREEASTSSTTQTTIATFSASSFDAAKVVITANDGTDTYATELLIVHDGTTASATEYAQVGSGSNLASYDVDINTGNVRILATAASATATTYKVTKILM